MEPRDLYYRDLQASTSSYTKEDFLLLKDILSSHQSIISVKFIYDILDIKENIQTGKKNWVLLRMAEIDALFPFVTEFFTMPFVKIPLTMPRFGKEGIGFLVMRWRLEIGK